MAEWLREVSVGEWFETGEQTFEIVGVDANAGVVLVQHFDGSLEEFDFDTWLDLSARPCAAPEDCSGALDQDAEDEEALRHGHWDNPLDQLAARLDDY